MALQPLTFKLSLTFSSTVWPIQAQFDLFDPSLTYPSTVWSIQALFDLLNIIFLYSFVGASVLYEIVLKHNSVSLKIVELITKM